jgi:hypothetical protein
MTTATINDLESAAKEAAGNWQKFDCFCWHRKNEIESPQQWTIIYTHNRDSGLLDRSNAEVIATAIQPFSTGEDPDVVFESHHHWAVGHVDGASIRVYRDGSITDAFRAYHALQARLADYPILDEEDYSAKEYEATLGNITDAAWRLKNQYDLPNGWESKVYSWLSDREPREIENTDDQGGYPSEEALRRAIIDLGYTESDRTS